MRVLLIEDDPWISAAVEAVLAQSPAISSVQVCGSAEQALATPAALRFDVALVDLGLPGRSGLWLIGELHRRDPRPALVAFTVLDEPRDVLTAMRSGARGYLLKDTSPERLVAALSEAAEGGAPLSPRVARFIVDELAEHDESGLPALTPREQDVLGLLARGLTYAEVAETLAIGMGTVQGYVKVIYQKLDVTTKAEAALIASKLGLV